MGRLVVTEFITLDGVIEDPGGAEQTARGGWAFRFDQGAEGPQFKLAELMDADAQLLGRVTYEGFAKAWPAMAGANAFAEKMNGMPKFVVSSTLDAPAWNNTTVLRGPLSEEVGRLKQRFTGDILVAGSAQLTRALLAEKLVDALHLMVFPVVLGEGKRLFAEGTEELPLVLTETKRMGSVAVLTLHRQETS